jgi:hypothetical protein
MTPPPTEAELRAFAGYRADYYMRVWRKVLSGQSRLAQGNIWAVFFPVPWLGYRKLYRPALVLFVLLMAEWLAEVFIFGIYLRTEPPVALELILVLAVMTVCGTFGNSWYLSKAIREIEDVRKLGLPSEGHLRELSRRGGGSVAGFLKVIMLFFLGGMSVWMALNAWLGGG